MNTIKLQKISLKNFKGIKNYSVELPGGISSILGANGTGKTSLFDAFTWLLFGKDSSEKKDFQVKTLDKNNVVIPKIDHEVSAEIEVNGKVITLRRLLTEKWVKARGSETSVFSGNQTTFFWNDVEMGAKEFQTKVSEILDENVFKLITSPFAFNKLHWTEKRKVLTQIAGDVSDDEIANGDLKFTQLVSTCITDSISIDERKKQISGAIKRLSAELVDIPSRIDEVVRNAPEFVNEDEVNDQIEIKNQEIAKIDKSIQDSAAANMEVNKKIQDNQNKIFELKSEMNGIEFTAKETAKAKVREYGTESADLVNDLALAEKEADKWYDRQRSIETALPFDEKNLENLIGAKNKLTELWHTTNSRAFEVGSDSKCPCCNQTIEVDIEELKEKFIASKKEQLLSITNEGKGIAARILETEGRIAQSKSDLELCKKNISDLLSIIKGLTEKQKTQITPPTFEEAYNKIILDSVEYSKLRMEIAALEANSFKVPESNEDLANDRTKLFNDIISLKESVSSNKLIEASQTRIAELRDEETKLNQEIAKQERGLFIIENFMKAKMDAVELKVNEKFTMVKIKMFETQVNGAEAEACEILIDGVPFADANTASKINAGIDIINTLSEFYETSAPIFIDNRESVSELIETPSQIINLIVSPEHKKLTLK